MICKLVSLVPSTCIKANTIFLSVLWDRTYCECLHFLFTEENQTWNFAWNLKANDVTRWKSNDLHVYTYVLKSLQNIDVWFVIMRLVHVLKKNHSQRSFATRQIQHMHMYHQW